MRYSSRSLTLCVSSIIASGVCLPAFADDTEIFNVAATSPSNPNILFILDTSGSMDSAVYKRPDYNPATTYDSSYTHACDSTKIYYETGTTVPTCGTAATVDRRGRPVPEVLASPSFVKTALQCTTAKNALWADSAAKGYYGGTGVGDNAIRWLTTTQVTSSTSTPGNNAQTRTITNTRTQTTTVTTTYGRTVRSPGGATSGSGTVASHVISGPSTVVTLSGVTSSTGAWGATSFAASGPAVTNSSTSTSTYQWSTNLTAPANASTSSNTSAPTGVPTSNTTPGAWANFGAATNPSGNPTTSAWTNVGIPYTSSGRLVQDQTQTVSNVTYQVQAKPDIETQSTPVSNTAASIATTYAASDVECDGDATTGTVGLGYPNNVPPSSTEWTPTKANSYWDTGGGLQQYSFYSGNYLNYVATTASVLQGTRIQVMQTAIGNLLASTGMAGKNAGLMRYSDNGDYVCVSRGGCDQQAQGGMVTYAMSPVDTNKTAMTTVVNGYVANGYTPLSETLYEAYQYYSGGSVYYGNTSKVQNTATGLYVSSPSVAPSRTSNTLVGTQYKTPIVGQCQNNYIVYLTDGLPTMDTSANGLIQALPNFAANGGTCNSTSADGGCLSALAQYMYKTDLNSSLTGSQGVASYFIGFGSDFSGAGGASAFAYLQDAARRGGGQAYSAADSDALESQLKAIVGDIVIRNESFAAPSVAVNAFNRTQTLNELYMSVFRPTANLHWPGNVKKYHLEGGVIVDQNGDPATDPATGFFTHSSKSFWTSGDPDGAGPLIDPAGDGDNVPAGGAAHKLPGPTLRNVYTYISGTTKPSTPVALAGAGYALNTANSAVTSALLGDATMTSAQHDTLINWARGQDVDDADNTNGITTDTRSVMGDPVHARPAVVIYGGTATDPETVVFAPTNDGYLHAIGGKDSEGVELWSFIPQELLPGLKPLHDNLATTTKHYALDGDVVVAKFDVNGDGIIQPSQNDVVKLFFSQGRGGSNYYALDVTDKNAPKFMWSLSASDLPGIGQSWSTPVLARVNINGATQNNQKEVLIFGGGYDPAEEGTGYRTSNTVGNHIYMVDALYGTLLWSAGSSGANLNIARMDHAIPSSINVLDTDNDGFADRMYVGDMAGQLFRFDIFNGQSAANLVTGGVIASLGTHDDSMHTDANNRRFYNAPDVSLATPVGVPAYFNVAIGSGYRGHPLNTTIQDRFYAIRDRNPYTQLNQTQYNAIMASTVIHDSDTLLTNITSVGTTVPSNAVGWKLLLNDPSWQGEKVLAASLTFDNKILFTTYTPGSSVATPSGCGSTSTGSNRLYAISVFDGAPVKQHNDSYDNACSGSCGTIDRYDDLRQSGIAPAVVLLFPGGSGGNGGGSGGSDPFTPPCLVGAESCNGPSGTGIYKTSWQEMTSH